MDEEGFIVSNKFRRTIFDELSSGERNIVRITKKHHIIPAVAKRIVQEFKDHGLAEQTSQGIKLTEKGEKLVQTLGK